MSTERDKREPDDADIENSLRGLSADHEPTAEASDAVRAVVHAEWQAMLAQRRTRNFAWVTAASALIYAVIRPSLIRSE